MPTNTGLISLEDILLLCQMTGRNQLAQNIINTQFDLLDINHDGFLSVSQFCHFIAVTINIWEPLYRLRYSLITKLFPSKEYYSRIFERKLNIHEIKEYKISHKGKYKKLSCIKYIQLFLKNESHPDQFDYEPENINTLNNRNNNFGTRSMKLTDINNINKFNNKFKGRSTSAVLPENNNLTATTTTANATATTIKPCQALDSLIAFYICKYKTMNNQNNNKDIINDSTLEPHNLTNNTNNTVVNTPPVLSSSPSYNSKRQSQHQQQRFNNNNNIVPQNRKAHFKMKYLRLKYPYKIINAIDHFYDLNYKQVYNSKRKKSNNINNNQLNGEAFSARLSEYNNTDSLRSEDSQCFVFSAHSAVKHRPSSSILKANRFTKTSSTLSENQSFFGGNLNPSNYVNTYVPSGVLTSGRMNNVTSQTTVIIPNALVEANSDVTKVYKIKPMNLHVDSNYTNETEYDGEKEK